MDWIGRERTGPAWQERIGREWTGKDRRGEDRIGRIGLDWRGWELSGLAGTHKKEVKNGE